MSVHVCLCMDLCTCVHVCMCACVSCMCLFMRVSMDACICACVSLCMRVSMDASVHMSLCACVSVHVCACASLCTCVYVFMCLARVYACVSVCVCLRMRVCRWHSSDIRRDRDPQKVSSAARPILRLPQLPSQQKCGPTGVGCRPSYCGAWLGTGPTVRGSPLCVVSRGAMVLWCHTVTSSVQGSTMRTIARMSRLFGISKAGWAHSSSLPERRQGQEKGGPGGDSSRQWQAQGRKEQEWAGRARRKESREAECWLAGLTSAHNPPIAEAGLQGLARPESGKGWLCQGALRSPAKWTPARESRTGWPETWGRGWCPAGPGRARRRRPLKPAPPPP